MKSIKTTVLMMFLVTVLGLLSGCGPEYAKLESDDFYHFVDVYVNEDLEYVTLENDKGIGALLIFPGDILIINNLTKDKVVIDLVPGVFETELQQVTIEGNRRVGLRVLKEAKLDGAFRSTKNDLIIDASPKVVIGEGP